MALLPRAVGRWYRPVPEHPRGTRARHDRLGRNDRCPCGCGFKLKKCPRGSLERRADLGPRPPNIDEILDATRPLHIDPGVEEFLLFRSGSCFLVTFRADLWIVASAHAFRNQNALPEQARVLASLVQGAPADMLIPIEAVDPLDGDDYDTAWRDFVLLRTTRKLPSWMRVLDLDQTALGDLDRATPDDWLRVCGFPNEQDNEVDYASPGITVSRLNLDGRYVGPTESKYVHSIRFESLGVVDSLNGMSGGPVFYTKRGEEPFSFAGILVSEGTGRVARFIDARAIIKTLIWHYDRNPTATVDPSKRRRGR